MRPAVAARVRFPGQLCFKNPSLVFSHSRGFSKTPETAAWVVHGSHPHPGGWNKPNCGTVQLNFRPATTICCRDPWNFNSSGKCLTLATLKLDGFQAKGTLFEALFSVAVAQMETDRSPNPH
jgi:hypothetical protein